MVGFVKSALNLLGLNAQKKEGVEVSAESSQSLEGFLNDLSTHLGMDLKFVRRTDKDEPGLHYDVEGPDAGSLLGENCEILDALSHVSMRVLRKSEGLSNTPLTEGIENYRVTFDAADFRSKKTQELKDLAADHRQKVIESGGKPSYIKALSPSDRKVIHTTLAEMGEVTSESIGKGNFKRIRIKLKDDSQYKKDPPPRSSARAEGGGSNSNDRRGGGRRPNNRSGGGGRGGRSFRGNNDFRRNPSRGDSQPNSRTDSQPDFDTADSADDNIGNRLKPGESHIFSGFTGGNNNVPGSGQQ
jgi:predicted RNA-binding protein Jag